MCGKVEMIKRKYIFLLIIIGISSISLTGCRRDAVSYMTEEDAGISGTDSIESSMADVDTDTALSENDQTETEASEQGQSENETEIISERTPQLPNTGRKLDNFVPEGWSILDSVELDFNEDGIMDYVGVLETFSAEYQKSDPRILFGIASDGVDAYRLDFQDINLIRTRDEGGVFGDPYEPLTVDGLSFTTYAYGGSAWRWSEHNTYTYQEGVWRLTSSEDFYGYYDYTTSYSKNDWESGIGIRKQRSSEFCDMEKNWDTMDTIEDTIEYDVEYELSLDDPMTLEQAGMRWWLAPKRVTDWDVKSITFGAEVELLEDMVVLPNDRIYNDYGDEDCFLYVFSDINNEFYYIAMYRWKDKALSVLVQEESCIDDLEIYKGKIYYSTEIVENRTYKIIEDGEETVGFRLNRIELDGTGKETIFEYRYPKEKQEMIGEVPYLALNYELSGDEIVVEIYIGDEPHPFYRMKTDGSGLKMIGQMPADR